MTAKLLFNMVFGVFSLNPRNMRWFNVRRLLVVLFVLPFFLTLLIVNNVFLLLDYVLFPQFLTKRIVKPVFIISAPRSATTYLYHTLSKSERYTCMKLWEIVFAPSIIQKFLLLGVLKFDAWIGSPFRKLIAGLENIFIGKLKKIHLIGLNLPEEDEAILLWSLSSFYFNFFYPDSHFFDDLVLFDKAVGEKRKQRIMNSYERYVKRHNFVFNRKGEKQYLSKNPLMMCKVAAIGKQFPDAQLINIIRSPASTFPSTQELNRTLYALFTSKPVPTALEKRTDEILMQWYVICEENLQKHFADRHIKVHFRKLVSNERSEIAALTTFLGLSKSVFDQPKQETSKTHKSSNKYQPLSEEELAKVLEEIPFVKPYC